MNVHVQVAWSYPHIFGISVIQWQSQLATRHKAINTPFLDLLLSTKKNMDLQTAWGRDHSKTLWIFLMQYTLLSFQRDVQCSFQQI